MILRQYTVTLTDLGTYQVQVAAGDVASAKSIAINTLHEAVLPTPGLQITGRTTDAVAVLDEVQPERLFKVTATEVHDMEVRIAAPDRATAVLHARRIIDACGPLLDFDLVDSRIGDDIRAVEVAS